MRYFLMIIIVTLSACADLSESPLGWNFADDTPDTVSTAAAAADPLWIEPRPTVARTVEEDAVRAVFPPHGVTVSDSTPTLRWHGSAGSYHVSVCRQRWCRCPLFQRTTSDSVVEVDAPLAPGLYWWTVSNGEQTSLPRVFRVSGAAEDRDVTVHWGSRIDLTGSGFADVLAADWTRVAWVFGGSTMQAPVEQQFFAPDPGVSVLSLAAADVNGDGEDEVIIGRSDDKITVSPYYIRGRFEVPTPGETGARFGTTVTNVGDVDGDGFGDLAVSAPGEREGLGAVYVMYGAPWGSERFDRIAPDAAEVGVEIAGPLDANRDGYSDFVISGSPWQYLSGGQIWVVFGGPDGVEAVPSGITGDRVAVGDLDGNGLPDFATDRSSGCVAQFIARDDRGFDERHACSTVADRATLSDLALLDDDGDGRDDLTVGVVDHGDGFNKTFVSRLRDDTEEVIASSERGWCVGRKLATPGDVDGDGLGDLVMSHDTCAQQEAYGVIVRTAAGGTLLENPGWGHVVAR